MPEGYLVVDGIESWRMTIATPMFSVKLDLSGSHDSNCQVCDVGKGQSPDAYTWSPGTSTIYDRRPA